MNKDDSILVTGSSGMVGKVLVEQLRDQGYQSILGPSSKQLDLRDQKSTQGYFEKNHIDVVLHLAGHIGGIGGSTKRPYAFLYENMIMAMNIIHAAQASGVKKLLFVGSSCIYPRNCPQPMKEEHLLTDELEPTNEGYALAKISGLKLCEYSNQQFGTNYISLMPCNLFGRNDHFETANSHVISALITKFHQGKTENAPHVEVWGTGKARREFLFADDFAEALIFFAKKYDWKDLNSFVNIGFGKDIAISELAVLIKKTVGYTGTIKFNSDRPDGMPQKLLDVSLATRLGWKAKTSLEDGIKQSYQSYLEQLKTV